jgi:outer membrane protein OmpA-like peptidoglycan-associated protein
MKDETRIAVALVTLAAALASGCSLHRVFGRAHRVHETIVLLADSESGVVGRADVSNPSGSVELAAEREATDVVTQKSPGAVRTLSDADVARMFGGALSALPVAPRHFTLYFKFDTDELTDESRAMLPDILTAVKEHSVPDVIVVGHTDTSGTPAANFELGMKRATAVRDLLVQAGLASTAVEATSHGEGDLLIQTPDETPEQRNRRVEISVR